MYYISNRSPLPESSVIVRGKNLVPQVYQILYKSIISLWLKPGQPLREKEICKQMVQSSKLLSKTVTFHDVKTWDEIPEKHLVFSEFLSIFLKTKNKLSKNQNQVS